MGVEPTTFELEVQHTSPLSHSGTLAVLSENIFVLDPYSSCLNKDDGIEALCGLKFKLLKTSCLNKLMYSQS